MNTFSLPLKIDPFNIILMTDGYKPSHWKLYPDKLQFMQSYYESRKGAKWDTTVFFGLQYFLLKYFVGQVVTEERIQEAKHFFANYFGNPDIFNEDGWRYILEKHGGYLPLKIRALPEGTVCPVSCAMMVLENTDPNCAWLVNYVETILVEVWYSCTVATQSREIRKRIWRHVERTGGTKAHLDWMVHDFGYRGVSSPETAALGGAAHLISFNGSDTLAGDILLRNYYDGNGLVSGSIPASEHSTVTTWGEPQEIDFMEHALKAFPTGILANVIDSYDDERFIGTYAKKNSDLILNRDGKYVFRPDSGEPRVQSVKVLDLIGETFGGQGTGWQFNDKGYKELNPKLGAIYGDGMDYDSIDDLYLAITGKKWAAHNMAIGSGGGLLQKVNRDTQRFAFKACWAQVNDNPRDVFKRPSTDPTKNSKSGRLHVLPIDNLVARGQGKTMYTISEREAKEQNIPLEDDLLELVYENGKILRLNTLEEIRQRARF